MSESRSRVVVGFFSLIAVMFISFLIFSFFSSKKLFTHNSSSFSADLSGSEVGVVEIKGPIMDSNKIVRKLLIAEEDESLKALIVRIDSPGGAVGPTQEIYDEIIRIDKNKPVYASFGSVAASGGYYIGAAARKNLC